MSITPSLPPWWSQSLVPLLHSNSGKLSSCTAWDQNEENLPRQAEFIPTMLSIDGVVEYCMKSYSGFTLNVL